MHTLPYWGSDEELLSVVNMLEDKGRYDRDEPIKYVCAPSEFGKTTSIVPAFLKSDVFTHYLYVAFHNNRGRSFRVSPPEPHEAALVAGKQGAAFAVECVRIPRIPTRRSCRTRCRGTTIRRRSRSRTRLWKSLSR